MEELIKKSIYLVPVVLLAFISIMSYNIGKREVEAQARISSAKAELIASEIEKKILEEITIQNIELKEQMRNTNSDIQNILKNDYYNRVCIDQSIKSKLNDKVEKANAQ